MSDDKDLKKEEKEKISENENIDADDTKANLDDSFLDLFEQEMLSSSDQGLEKITIESDSDSTDDEYTDKIEQYIDNADVDVDINEIKDTSGIDDLDIDFDNIDVSKIDLSKLKIKGIDVDNIKIGFDLDKLKLENYKIDIDKINTDNIKFDNINLDLGTIISFEENLSELKKMNILLTSPVKGFYGFFFVNPYQELRNAFKKTYMQIIQLTRPAEAFKTQLKSKDFIDGKDILEVQKQIVSKKSEKSTDDKDFEAKVDKELELELGENWNSSDNKEEAEDSSNNSKEKSSSNTSNKLLSKVFNLLLSIFRFFRGLYLRISLMSIKAKFVILVHTILIVSFSYLVNEYSASFIKLVWSTRNIETKVEDTSLLNLAKTSKNPNKRLIGPVVTIDKIICSFMDKVDNQKSRQLEISLYVEVESHEVQTELYNNVSKIKSGIISLVGSKDLFKMSSPVTKEHLKIEIINFINKNLKTGKAIKVFYKTFVIN